MNLFQMLLMATLFMMNVQAQAESLLRIKCGEADAGAEVYVNGKFKGECPVDVQVPAGTISLRVVKPAGEGKERVFEQSMRLADGTAKAVNAELGAPQWTAEGLKREQKRLEAEQSKRKELLDRLQPLIPQLEANMIAIPGKKYAMGKFEVTQGEWVAVMGSNPSHFTTCGENCPVEQVSWNDIQEFLKKLNARTSKQYRLPTEAEWEYACYGGKGGVFGSTDYCGGDNVDAVAWYDGNSSSTTHPVGLKQANGYGLHDMSGNVWEWMENRYDSSHEERALRGGAWNYEQRFMGVANRLSSSPGFRYNYFGFRLARTLP